MNLFDETRNNLKKSWRALNGIIGNKKSTNIKQMVFDGEHFPDISLITGKQNNLFVNIAKNLNRSLPTNYEQPTQFLS